MRSFHKQPTGRAEATCWGMNAAMRPANMVTLVAEADATSLQRLRAACRNRTGAAPSCTALVIKAAALTLDLHPQANRAILGPPLRKRLYQFDNLDIGVVVEKTLPMLPGQAFAAPIRDAAAKSAARVTAELAAPGPLRRVRRRALPHLDERAAVGAQAAVAVDDQFAELVGAAVGPVPRLRGLGQRAVPGGRGRWS